MKSHVAVEISSCTKKLNQDFLSTKRGIIWSKDKTELWDLMGYLGYDPKHLCEVSKTIASVVLEKSSFTKKLNQGGYADGNADAGVSRIAQTIL